MSNGLVWLLILACPFVHLFMSHGYDEGEQIQDSSEVKEGEENHLEA